MTGIVIGNIETLWEKEKMLVTSIFSFSHNVFKSLLPHGHLMEGLFLVCTLSSAFKSDRPQNSLPGKFLYQQQHFLTLYQTIHCLNDFRGKEKNAGNQYFLLFQQCFLSFNPTKSFKVYFGEGVTLPNNPGINNLLNDKILDWSKFKAFVVKKTKMWAQKFKNVYGRVESIMGEKRKCWLPAFIHSPMMFPTLSLTNF